MIGVGKRRQRLVGCRHNRCQILGDHLGHDLETGVGVTLAEGVRVLRVVSARVLGSDRGVTASSDKWAFQERDEPIREGYPVVGDDRVINISPPASLGWSRPGMHAPV